ncbi:MAG TPA: TNT domain-containing protein [Solirubrobacteraceae bacterium]|jgi:hypothetical protein|nr:TNT domain-containing protein [Solirubrobacteraceae bacterium]
MRHATIARHAPAGQSARPGRAGRARRRRRLAAAVAAVGLLALGGSATAGAASPPSLGSLFPTLTTTCSTAFYDGDSRLGPAQFQTLGSVALMLFGYNRLAGLSPQRFIATYWDPTANSGAGSWRYPPDNGYLLIGGNPVEYVSTLTRGEEIDRFGSEFGTFLAPEYTPYAARSLPPQSLDDFDPAYTCNYHLYRVVKPFKADEGLIAPAFGQPGLGLQIQLDPSLVSGAPTAGYNVMWLINNGYLARAN